MNPDFRRVALIAASLGLLVSLFVALRPDDEEETARTTVAQTTTSPATTEPPTTAPAPPATTLAPVRREIQINLVNGRPEDGIQRESVDVGDEVVVEVRADVTDHLHLHGYDLMADVAPGSPGKIEFTASTPGRFEIELEDRGLQIAELEVRP